MFATLFMIWPFLNLFFTNYQVVNFKNPEIDNSEKIPDKILVKINNNICSGIHSVMSVVYLLNYLYSGSLFSLYTSISVSSGYFLWDTYSIVIRRDTANYPYIIHHIIALIVIEQQLQDVNRYLLSTLFCIAEISNFPIYIVYHLKKTNYLCNILKYQFLQLIWFSIYRIIIFTTYLPDCIYQIDSYFIIVSLLIVYTMGLYWTFGQYRSLYRQYKQLSK